MSLMGRLRRHRAAMAERVLRAGARGWRRWSTLRRNAGKDFSPFEVEYELLDDLCRNAGLTVEDGWRNQRWQPDKIILDRSVWSWLNILDPEAVRAELEQELTDRRLLDALAAGPPTHVDWRSFSFVLRAADQVVQLSEHDEVPGARELAGLVDHTKAWTARRKLLLEELLGQPFNRLVTALDRQIGIRGPLPHTEGGIWASAVPTINLSVAERARGVILVENKETFQHMVELADQDWVVLHVPGGPPPAEADLVHRLNALAPHLTFYACFDPDPAGIRIARLLEERSGVTFDPAGMQPQFLLEADRQLELNDWDHDQLQRLDGNAGAFEPLRQAILQLQRKGEQETYQRRLSAISKTPSLSATDQATDPATRTTSHRQRELTQPPVDRDGVSGTGHRLIEWSRRPRRRRAEITIRRRAAQHDGRLTASSRRLGVSVGRGTTRTPPPAPTSKA